MKRARVIDSWTGGQQNLEVADLTHASIKSAVWSKWFPSTSQLKELLLDITIPQSDEFTVVVFHTEKIAADLDITDQVKNLGLVCTCLNAPFVAVSNDIGTATSHLKNRRTDDLSILERQLRQTAQAAESISEKLGEESFSALLASERGDLVYSLKFDEVKRQEIMFLESTARQVKKILENDQLVSMLRDALAASNLLATVKPETCLRSFARERQQLESMISAFWENGMDFPISFFPQLNVEAWKGLEKKVLQANNLTDLVDRVAQNLFSWAKRHLLHRSILLIRRGSELQWCYFHHQSDAYVIPVDFDVVVADGGAGGDLRGVRSCQAKVTGVTVSKDSQRINLCVKVSSLSSHGA